MFALEEHMKAEEGGRGKICMEAAEEIRLEDEQNAAEKKAHEDTLLAKKAELKV